jgi:hypothetical protein
MSTPKDTMSTKETTSERATFGAGGPLLLLRRLPPRRAWTVTIRPS